MRARENLNLKALGDKQTPCWFLPQYWRSGAVTVPELYVSGDDQVVIATQVDQILDEFIRARKVVRLYVTYHGRAGVSNLVTSADPLALTKRHALFSFLGERVDHSLVRITALPARRAWQGLITEAEYEEVR